MAARFTLLMAIVFSIAISGCGTTEEPTDDLGDMAGSDSEVSVEDEGGGEEFDDFAEDEAAPEAEESIADEAAPQEEPAVEEAPAEKATEPAEQIAEEEPALKDEAPLEEQFDEPTETAAADEVPANRVVGINFLKAGAGGTVEIKTESPATFTTRTNAETNQFIVEVQNAALPDSLKRPFIMKDFDGNFGTINAYQNAGGGTARIVIQLKGPGEPVVTQEGNSLLVLPGAISVAKSTPPAPTPVPEPVSDEPPSTEPGEGDQVSYDVAEAKKTEKVLGARSLDEFLTSSGRFFGRPISIQTNDADVRDVIGFIAEESGVNLVISDDVTGKISLKLRQVPWDQALMIVMRSKGLGYVRQGNVIRITKLTTLQAEAESAKKIVDSQKDLTPLKVKVMPVSYASVADLSKQILPFLTANRGKVVSDERTSSLIITDTAEILQRIERLVKELDIPPAQVMIEGKIVEAGEAFSRRVGLNWNLTGAAEQIAASGGNNGGPINFSSGLTVANLDIAQAGAGALSMNLRVGTLDFLGNLNAQLSLLQSDSLVRIISSPRVVTMNRESAEISQKGEQISIDTTVDANGAQTSKPTRTPVELKLKVNPQITAEGSVILEVEVKRQFVGPGGDVKTNARPINTREAKTKVLVPSGQTAVIGGIYQSDENETESGTPILKDIPVLGWLFKSKQSERNKNELLLFLTPRILNAKEQTVVE